MLATIKYNCYTIDLSKMQAGSKKYRKITIENINTKKLIEPLQPF